MFRPYQWFNFNNVSIRQLVRHICSCFGYTRSGSALLLRKPGLLECSKDLILKGLPQKSQAIAASALPPDVARALPRRELRLSLGLRPWSGLTPSEWTNRPKAEPGHSPEANGRLAGGAEPAPHIGRQSRSCVTRYFG